MNITNKWKTVRVVVERLNPFKVERREHGPVDYIPKCLYQARRSGKNGLRGRFVNVLGSGTGREISYTFPIDANILEAWGVCEELPRITKPATRKAGLTVEEVLQVLADTVEQRGGYAKGSKVDRAVKKAKEIIEEGSN